MPPIRRRPRTLAAEDDNQTSITTFFNRKSSASPYSAAVSQRLRSAVEPAPEEAPPAAEYEFPVHPVVKGKRQMVFGNEFDDWDTEYNKLIGTSTTGITLDDSMPVSDKHMNQLVALGPRICRRIENVRLGCSFDLPKLRKISRQVTDVGIMRLAEACPRLRCLWLNGCTRWLTDASLVCLFANCRQLEVLNIGAKIFEGSAFHALKRYRSWAPNLESLSVGDIPENKMVMAPQLEASRTREKLMLHLYANTKEKIDGEWVDFLSFGMYKKGRKFDKYELWDPVRESESQRLEADFQLARLRRRR